jgi:POT family proton-dependent oligopeptide transporter
MKFAAGTVVMGLAFLLFLPMASPAPNSAPLLGLVGVLLVFTLAELLLSPVGLSLSTKLAPRAFRTQMVSLWFLSSAIGTALAGQLAGSYSENSQAAYFGVLGSIAVVLGLALALATPAIRRLMSGVH